MTAAYPLQWPTGRPRTKRTESSRFNVTMARARDGLFNELHLMGARHAVLSTNVALRQDGLPYANQKEPDDRGVAVYFEKGGRQMAFSCDRWNLVGDNIQAIRHTIAALRGLDRWGTGDAVDAAFTGFVALPPPAAWRDVLGDVETLAEVGVAFRRLALRYHPDIGGSDEKMAALNAARAAAETELAA